MIFEGWLTNGTFKKQVSDSWTNNVSIGENIKNFSNEAKVWNQEVFENISMRKQRLTGRLKGVQRAMDSKATQNLQKLAMKLSIELEHVLDSKELFWK